jgi:hypothetical protein
LIAVTLFAAVLPARVSAEWQLKPFFGGAFGGETTFVDLDHAVGNKHAVVGASGVWLGEVLGVEADLGHSPGFFQTNSGHLVVGSRVTTLTGNIVVALPRRMTQYTLRPYFVGGGGLMVIRSDDKGNVLQVARAMRALDIGGGATGFLTDRVGVDWQVRYFRTIGGIDEQQGISTGAEQLSFWRASMALVIRY